MSGLQSVTLFRVFESLSEHTPCGTAESGKGGWVHRKRGTAGTQAEHVACAAVCVEAECEAGLPQFRMLTTFPSIFLK